MVYSIGENIYIIIYLLFNASEVRSKKGGFGMQEIRYMISDTAKKVEVEAHVLRYWEEELNLNIARNEMGHRYYTAKDILVFQNIKKLKEQGFQLKTIKMVLPARIHFFSISSNPCIFSDKSRITYSYRPLFSSSNNSSSHSSGVIFCRSIAEKAGGIISSPFIFCVIPSIL